MKCFANRVTAKLMNTPQQNPFSATVNGQSVRILPDQTDRQTDAAQEFKFITSLAFSGGANSPTAQLVIQGSVDNVGWVDLVSGTVRTTDGTYPEVLDSNSVGLLPWVRARAVLGGGTAPNVIATVDVVSTGPFQISSS